MVDLCPDFFPSQILGLQWHHIDLCIGMAHVTVKKNRVLKSKRLILGKAICFFKKTFLSQGDSNVTIMCLNDELSSTMKWVGCLLKDSKLIILFAENSQILLKISVMPILVTLIFLLKYGSQEMGSWFYECSPLLGFIMSKKQERLRSELLSEDKITNLLVFLT